MISGFTFIHNAIEAGYPIVQAIQAVIPYVDEMVVVDMQSTDGTRDVLQHLGVRILDMEWTCQAGKTLALAHSMNVHCKGEVIIHFEGDEVFDEKVLHRITGLLRGGIQDIAVYRLQVEQNFQRCRWYPEPVHRVFPRGSVRKVGHTTDRHSQAYIVSPEYGFLWDVTNCFRDNWLRRIKNQSELWSETEKYRMVPLHFLHGTELNREQACGLLESDHWTWTRTPLDLPDILLPLVGKTRYVVEL